MESSAQLGVNLQIISQTVENENQSARLPQICVEDARLPKAIPWPASRFSEDWR